MAEAGLLACVLMAGLAGPYAIGLDRAAPGRAAAAWLSVLALRAALVVSAILLMLAAVPTTGVFKAVSQATLHRPLPIVEWHPDLSGDALAHVALILPAAALALSLAVLVLGRLIAARRLKSLVTRRGLGSGPSDSVVVADDRIVAGVPRVGRGRVLISHAALAAFDGPELEAALAHELGHLRRRHRPLQLVAAVLACAGRTIPGTRRAERGFRLSLERDADDYAVSVTGDPLGLASAICKAARSGTLGGSLALAGAGAEARLEHLLAGGRRPALRRVDRAAVALAASLFLLSAAFLCAVAVLIGASPASLLLAIACS